MMRQYLTQLRQELGLRLVPRVFDTPSGKPSKVLSVLTKCHLEVSLLSNLSSVVDVLPEKKVHGQEFEFTRDVVRVLFWYA